MKWLLALIGTALADTCANCHYNDVVGVWDFKGNFLDLRAFIQNVITRKYCQLKLVLRILI